MRKALLILFLMVTTSVMNLYSDDLKMPEGTYLTRDAGVDIFFKFYRDGSARSSIISSFNNKTRIAEYTGSYRIEDNFLYLDVEFRIICDDGEYSEELDPYTERLGKIINLSEERIILNLDGEVIYMIRI